MAKVEGDQLELHFPTCRDEETQGVILEFYGTNWDTVSRLVGIPRPQVPIYSGQGEE